MPKVTLADITAAASTIGGSAVRTPLLEAHPSADRRLWVKPENLQPIGAFKIRGAVNAVTAAVATGASVVVAHSSGNHGQAVASAARTLGLRAIIVVPDTAPAIKVDAMRALGAELEIVAPDQRVRRTEELASALDAVIVPPFDDDLVIAGQGTVGLEIAEDLGAHPEVTTVLVPIGGGGLISGVAIALAALAPHLKVVGVEPELAADAAESWNARELRSWAVQRTSRTIADGLRTGLSERTWGNIEANVADVITVTEQQIVEASRYLFDRAQIVAEPSGAVATAGFLSHPDRTGDNAVAVVSGGNVTPAWFAKHVLLGQQLPS